MILHVDMITGGISPLSSPLTYTMDVPDSVTIEKESTDNSNKTLTLVDNLSEFNVTEILERKYSSLLDESQGDYIISDTFLDASYIDLKDVNHSANTGVALLELLPLGQAKTKTIALQKSTNVFTLTEFDTQGGVEIYLNDKKFVDNKLVLTSGITNCIIKFVNTTSKAKFIKSYAITY